MRALLAVVFLLVAANLYAGEEKVDQGEQAAPGKAAPAQQVKRADDGFTPTEKMDADAVVPFPTDI